MHIKSGRIYKEWNITLAEATTNMETALTLREALLQSRQENGGITLEHIARIIKEILDEAEVRALVNHLVTNQ